MPCIECVTAVGFAGFAGAISARSVALNCVPSHFRIICSLIDCHMGMSIIMSSLGRGVESKKKKTKKKD